MTPYPSLYLSIAAGQQSLKGGGARPSHIDLSGELTFGRLKEKYLSDMAVWKPKPTKTGKSKNWSYLKPTFGRFSV
jgi:hypothetical protein